MIAFSDTGQLPRRRFGHTGLQVTPVCLGCAPLASMPDVFYPVPEEQAVARGLLAALVQRFGLG